MTTTVLNTLLTQPQGQTLEFKRDLSSPKPLLKTLVAFANTAGGRLLVGMDDQRQVAQALPVMHSPAASTEQVTEQVTEQATAQVMKLLDTLAAGPLGAKAAIGALGLTHRPTQKYRLTPSGNTLAKTKKIANKPINKSAIAHFHP